MSTSIKTKRRKIVEKLLLDFFSPFEFHLFFSLLSFSFSFHRLYSFLYSAYRIERAWRDRSFVSFVLFHSKCAKRKKNNINETSFHRSRVLIYFFAASSSGRLSRTRATNTFTFIQFHDKKKNFNFSSPFHCFELVSMELWRPRNFGRLKFYFDWMCFHSLCVN